MSAKDKGSEKFQNPDEPLYFEESEEKSNDSAANMMEFTILIQSISDFYYTQPEQFVEGDEWKADYKNHTSNKSVADSMPSHVKDEVEKSFIFQLKKFQQKDG